MDRFLPEPDQLTDQFFNTDFHCIPDGEVQCTTSKTPRHSFEEKYYTDLAYQTTVVNKKWWVLLHS